MYVLKFILTLAWFGAAMAWDGDELEVFDVVEEVNQNFYTMLGVERDSDPAVIKKAFRKLSLVLHPDKNDSPDADVQFRQLVAVHDILKDPNKRKHYNNVLDNGLPNWKHAIYYYRKARKMGLKEMAVILFIIITIGQYLFGWAAYFERRLNIEDYLSSKSKKLQKKQKKAKSDTVPGYSLEEFNEILVKPSVKNTLPFQLPCLVWFVFVSGPPLLFRTMGKYWQERKLRKQQELDEQEEREEEVEVVQRAPRKRKTFVLPELKDDPSKESHTIANFSKPTTPTVISGGLWTDDDLLDLAKLVKKYPVGTTERWDKIGDAMNRPASEVAHMAHKLRDDVLKNLQQKKDADDGEENAAVVVEQPKKVKTKGGKVGEVGENDIGYWSQVQQKAFEAALLKFPKGAANDRWEKIAKCVPQKTKEECMVRYKYLVDLVKKKKEQDEYENGCDGEENSGKVDSQDSTKSKPVLENGESIT